jgi:hypothetical protein
VLGGLEGLVERAPRAGDIAGHEMRHAQRHDDADRHQDCVLDQRRAVLVARERREKSKQFHLRRRPSGKFALQVFNSVNRGLWRTRARTPCRVHIFTQPDKLQEIYARPGSAAGPHVLAPFGTAIVQRFPTPRSSP